MFIQERANFVLWNVQRNRAENTDVDEGGEEICRPSQPEDRTCGGLQEAKQIHFSACSKTMQDK